MPFGKKHGRKAEIKEALKGKKKKSKKKVKGKKKVKKGKPMSDEDYFEV